MESCLHSAFGTGKKPGEGGTLWLKIREGWLDSLGSEILIEKKDILRFFKNINLDNS